MMVVVSLIPIHSKQLVAYELAQKLGVDIPITEQLYEVLFKKGDVKKALDRLMMRPHKYEMEKFDN